MTKTELKQLHNRFCGFTPEEAGALLAEHPRLSARGGEDAPMLMSRCIEQGDPQKLRLLLNAGADPNAQLHGQSMLSKAVFFLDEELLKILLEFGANPSMPDSRTGTTPLMHSLYRDYSMMKVLFEAGADPRIQDHNGNDIFTMIGEPGPAWNAILHERLALARAAATHFRLAEACPPVNARTKGRLRL